MTTYRCILTLFMAFFLNYCNSKPKNENSLLNVITIDSSASRSKITLDSIPILNQISYPLSNKIGIPFKLNNKEYIIEGFEVGKDEKLYFLGGENSTIVCFKDKVELFRKNYNQFLPSQLHLYNSELFVFDYHYNSNNLFNINSVNGQIIGEALNITANTVNNYYFTQNSLVLRLFDSQKSIDMTTELAYIKFSLKGELIGPLDNLYDLKKNDSPQKYEEFLGFWKNYTVYWDLDSDNINYQVFIKNRESGAIRSKKILSDALGVPFYGLSGNPLEHRKLRNDKIYILGRKNEELIITIFPMEKIFP